MTTLGTGPAFATHDGTGEGDSSASTGTGLFEGLLDTGACTAEDTATTTSGTPTGRCGDGLSLNDQIEAFSQNASAPGDGTSSADASVAPIDIANFTSLDLTGVLDGVTAIDTGTVLDDVIDGVDPLLQPALDALVPTVVAPLDDALQQALGAVYDALPLSIEVGAVSSQCTAKPGSAEGSSTVAGIDILINLGGQVIHAPITLNTSPNSPLLVTAPQQLVNGVIDGLEDTFTDSLGGVLAPLNTILSTLQSQVTDAIFAQLEPALLQPLSDALSSLVAGTVNKQVPVSPSDGEIEVTALELVLLGDNVLDLARSHCGPNKAGTPHEATPTPTPEPQPGPEPTADIPTTVDSGQSGDSNAAWILGGTAALMLLGGGAGLLGYRRMLSR